MSIFDTVAQAESGGKNIPNTTAGTSSGQAQGYYQITTGTWQDFAPRAGVSLAQYPTPMTAADGSAVPLDVQTQVASVIPLKRWAPATQQAVFQQYGQLDPNQTLGVLNAQTGGGHLSPSGVQLASTGTGTGTGQGAGGTSFGTGLNPNAISPELGPGGALGSGSFGSQVTVSPDGGEAAVTVGLLPGAAKGLSDIANAATKAMSDTVTTAVATVMAPVKALFGSLADWFTRGALLVVGVLILALALWHIMAPAGMGPAAVVRKVA